jgi:hypothetical protein
MDMTALSTVEARRIGRANPAGPSVGLEEVCWPLPSVFGPRWDYVRDADAAEGHRQLRNLHILSNSVFE